MAQTFGVLSDSDDLIDRLRQNCPSFQFEQARGDAAGFPVVILDGDRGDRAGAAACPVRVILGSSEGERRRGDLRIARKAFLASPSEILSFASELAEATGRISLLEQEISYFSEIHELMTMVEAEAVSGRITRTVLSILDLRCGTLLIHDPRLERYVVSFSNDDDFRETGEFLPGIPVGLLQDALASPSRFASELGGDEGGLVVIPLQVGADLLGVIRIPLGPDDEITPGKAVNVTRYLAAVAQVLSNIYQLTRSRDLALRDDLTKAYNRRFFETYLDEEIERARRYGSIFTIIFLDLDDLRIVNERHGHLSGSRTLQEVAKRILGAVRGIDKVVRFGGDEFCIILPQTDQDQAIAVANRVRRALSGSSLQIDAAVDVSVTASFGVATFPIHATTKEDLIREADGAMYKVKVAGKNAVGIASLSHEARPVTL